jgi:alanine dehydrogenase
MATVVGVPKEVKEQEGRVSMQPDGVAELGDHGHEVVVQAAAGEGASFEDQGYVSCGARVVETADEVFETADLIVKVKEPVPEEYHRFHEGQELFTYLHLAADKELTEYLMDRKVNSIAYETVELPEGSLPLLAPMSEVAGRMAVQAAAHCLESPQGGAGLLLGGVPLGYLRGQDRPGHSEQGTDSCLRQGVRRGDRGGLGCGSEGAQAGQP